MENISMNIGNNIKSIRKSRRLTIDTLSLNSGVSKSMISEIERGVRNPSITVLWNIANSLKVPLNYLLKENNLESPIIYKMRDKLNLDENIYAIHPLMDFNEDRKFEIYFNEYMANSKTNASSHYDGVEEFALVTSGKLTLWIEGEEFTANEGEVIHFKANKSHYYCNKTDTLVKAFILMFY